MTELIMQSVCMLCICFACGNDSAVECQKIRMASGWWSSLEWLNRWDGRCHRSNVRFYWFHAAFELWQWGWVKYSEDMYRTDNELWARLNSLRSRWFDLWWWLYFDRGDRASYAETISKLTSFWFKAWLVIVLTYSYWRQLKEPWF